MNASFPYMLYDLESGKDIGVVHFGSQLQGDSGMVNIGPAGSSTLYGFRNYYAPAENEHVFHWNRIEWHEEKINEMTEQIVAYRDEIDQSMQWLEDHPLTEPDTEENQSFFTLDDLIFIRVGLGHVALALGKDTVPQDLFDKINAEVKRMQECLECSPDGVEESRYTGPPLAERLYPG